MKKLSIILAFLAVPFLGFSQENGPGNWLVLYWKQAAKLQMEPSPRNSV